MIPLKDLYEKIAALMIEEIDITQEREGFGVLYEEDDWYINVSFEIIAQIGYSLDDGYWTPCDKYCYKAEGSIEEVNASYYDEETNTDICPTAEEISDLTKYLQNKLDDYCKKV